MKKIIFTSLVLTTLAFPAFAKEVSGIYGKLGLGYGHAANYKISHKDTINTSGTARARGRGFAGVAAVGYGFSSGLRPELEFFATDGLKGKKGIYDINNYVKVNSKIGFMNAYYDFFNTTKASPFIMFGLGWGHIKTELNNSLGSASSNRSNFSFQIGAGSGYEITPKALFEFGYRYVLIGNKKLELNQTIPAAGGAVTFKVDRKIGEAHIGMLGLRMYF